MKLGVCTISNTERSARAVIDIAVELGFDGIEPWGGEHVAGDRDRCRHLADHAAAVDLTIPVYGSYLRPGTPVFADELDRELALAAALEARMIRVWAGNQEHQEVSDEHWTRVIADLETLATAATERSIAVTVERHAGTVTNTTEGAASLIDATPATVGLNWQPMFSHDAATVLADAETLAPRSNNVHLQSVPAPDQRNRCPLAYSYFDVAGVIDRFEAVEYDGYLEIEFVTDRSAYTPALASDAAFLRAIING